MKKNNKRRAVAKLVGWSVVLVALISVLAVLMVFEGGSYNIFGGGFSVVSGFTYSNSEKYLVGGKTYTEEIKNIDIEWAAGDITLKVHDGDEIIIEENGKISKESDRLRSLIENGTLYIKYAASGVRFFGASLPTKSLTVKIPRKYASAMYDIEVDAASASVSVETGIICTKLSLECASGDIDADVIAGEVELHAVSGGLTLRGEADNIDIDGVSGKAEIRLSNTPRSIEVNTVSGDIGIFLPKRSSFEAEMDSVSGKMQLNGKNVGKYCQEGDGASRFDFETVSGDVRIILD